MRQQQRREQPEFNPDRWMVSYADFITLLFAFFVVMYAISSVNEGKYRALSDTLRSNFRNDTTAAAAAPTPLAVEARRSGPKPIDMVAERLQEALGDHLQMDRVSLRRTERGVEVSIDSRLLFATGHVRVQPAYRPVLAQLAGVLGDTDHRIEVEGFTDNRPIETERFPSNWELSAARAAAVVRELSAGGVPPQNMAAVGYGPHRPVADNATAAGRARNRRVVLLVHASASDGVAESGR